jgi:hypothetical protein
MTDFRICIIQIRSLMIMEVIVQFMCELNTGETMENFAHSNGFFTAR